MHKIVDLNEGAENWVKVIEMKSANWHYGETKQEVEMKASVFLQAQCILKIKIYSQHEHMIIWKCVGKV